MSELKLRGGAARSPQDIVGGLLLVLLSVMALILVNHLPAAGRVGFASGTAPRLFAYGLLGLGLLIMIPGFFKEGPAIERFSFRGMATIIGSVLFFAFSIRIFGLALTGVPMVLIATAAASGYRWTEAIIFAFGITAFCAFLFPFALGQPIPLWPDLDAIARIPADIASAALTIINLILEFLFGNYLRSIVLILIFMTAILWKIFKFMQKSAR